MTVTPTLRAAAEAQLRRDFQLVWRKRGDAMQPGARIVGRPSGHRLAVEPEQRLLEEVLGGDGVSRPGAERTEHLRPVQAIGVGRQRVGRDRGGAVVHRGSLVRPAVSTGPLSVLPKVPMRRASGTASRT